MFRLDGKIAIVTGVTRGIGRAVALRFATLGGTIIGCYLQSEPHAESLRQALNHIGEGHIVLKCDLANPENAHHLCREALTRFGRLDIVVANAGIDVDGNALTVGLEKIHTLFQVNTFGAMELSKAAVKAMLAQKNGRIIFLGSIAALGMPRRAAYAASKAALIGWSNSLAQEFGPKGITSNVVAPGSIATDMQTLRSDIELQEIERRIALRRMGTTEEVAAVVAFLASESASYITGTVIRVDGGARLL